MSTAVLRFNSWRATCSICCEDVAVDGAATLACGHGWYCPGCMTRYVEARLSEGLTGEIPCPHCAAVISEEELVRAWGVYRLGRRRCARPTAQGHDLPATRLQEPAPGGGLGRCAQTVPDGRLPHAEDVSGVRPCQGDVPTLWHRVLPLKRIRNRAGDLLNSRKQDCQREA